MKKMLKLTLYNHERIIIECYKKIIDISDEKIRVDTYEIIGKNLRINKMDSFMIEVKGSVLSINTDDLK